MAHNSKKDTDNIPICYEEAKRQWQEMPNDIDPNKTNKEYYDEWGKKFQNEVFENAVKKFDEDYNTIFACPECNQKVKYGDAIQHVFYHRKQLSLKNKTEKQSSRALLVILFWGFLILLGWWLTKSQ